MGETDLDVPVTVPRLDIDIVGVGLPETDHDRVEDSPLMIEEGEEEKEEIIGEVKIGGGGVVPPEDGLKAIMLVIGLAHETD